MNSLKRNVIIWAVDVNQEPKETENIISELKTWSKRLKCNVQPVSVFSQSALSYPVDMTSLWIKGIENYANESLNQFLKKARAKGFLPPKIVLSKSFSNREMALELSKFAEKRNASVIFASTRAKKTWNPLRLGGFAETLVATSRVPVLLLNQAASPSAKIPNILFPTNFSKESKTALSLLEPWARSFKSKVLVYNQVENPSFYVSPIPGYVPALDWISLMKSAEKERTTLANRLLLDIRKHGIVCDAIVQHQRKSVASDILDVANKNHVDLIALSSHRGPLSQALLGGTARDILLQAKCPVLIFHRPKANRKRAEKTKIIYVRNNLKPTKVEPETMVPHV